MNDMESLENQLAVDGAGSALPTASRTPEIIAAEIRSIDEQSRGYIINAAIEKGRRLEEVKAQIPHGEWGPWLRENLGYSQSTAQNLMNIFRKYGESQLSLFGSAANSQTFGNLTYSKALKLLALPDEEREQFVAENDVDSMSTRQLEQAIRERDAAREAEAAAKADAAAAEESRAKMETDMAELKRLQESAKLAEEQARLDLETAKAQLKALREQPRDVAVQEVPDQKAIEKAREEAIAEMQKKVDDAQAAQKKAEEKRKSTEESLQSAQAALESAKAAGAAEVQKKLDEKEAELRDVRAQLEAAAKSEKQSNLAGDADLTAFKVLFEGAQEQVNKMHGILLKVRSKGDAASAEKLCRALAALADAVRRCAE